jgi:hypothetical protein
MNRIRTWAVCNLVVLALSIILTIVGAAVAGLDGAAVGGLSIWLLILVPLVFVRVKGGRLRDALDERERAILGRAMFAAFLALLAALLVAGGLAAVAGRGSAGLVFGLLLVGAPYVTVLVASVRAYVLVGGATHDA